MENDLVLCSQKIDELVNLLTSIQSKVADATKLHALITASAEFKEYLNQTNLSLSFEDLKTALLSDNWPVAVDKSLICDPNDEESKKERAYNIVDFLVKKDGGKFLDFGCGEGHTTYAAKDLLKSTFFVGYDIKKDSHWVNSDNLIFTDSYEEVKSNGPYDVILLYDVLDHVSSESPVSLLQKVYEVLSPTGEVHMRCHPWISVNGAHLHRDVNKAYAHLIFTEEELKLIAPNLVLEPNIKVVKPYLTYGKYIDDSKLKIKQHEETKHEGDLTFFKIPTITEKILQSSGMKAFPEFQMRINFIDYVLTK